MATLRTAIHLLLTYLRFIRMVMCWQTAVNADVAVVSSITVQTAAGLWKSATQRKSGRNWCTAWCVAHLWLLQIWLYLSLMWSRLGIDGIFATATFQFLFDWPVWWSYTKISWIHQMSILNDGSRRLHSFIRSHWLDQRKDNVQWMIVLDKSCVLSFI